MSKILVIEDESAIRRVLVKILAEESDSYNVLEAEDGLAGIETIKKEDFDLVLCDIKMPKISNFKEQTPTIFSEKSLSVRLSRIINSP